MSGSLKSWAWRIFRRDWRSGEVKVLFFALMIAVAAMVAIGSITDRIQRSMGEQASEFLGADYTLSSSREIPQSWVDRGLADGLQMSKQQGFSTVLSKDDNFQLVSVRALSGPYPLKGQLEISDKPFSTGQKLQGLPAVGEAWVEPRLLTLLNAKVGEQVEFGTSLLKISGVIVKAPGQASEVFNVAPSIIVNQQDVVTAGIIQAASRVNYRVLIAGPIGARDSYIEWLKPQLNSIQRITGGKEGTPALQASLQRAETFLRLASLIAVVLAGVAIAVAAGRFSRRHFDYAAIYRCLGMQIKQVHQLYLWQLGLIGAIGASLGVVLGWSIQQLIVWQFADFLPQPMVPISWVPVLVAALSGLVVLIGFALPSFIQIAQVSPLRVLRKELTPKPLASWLVYLISIAAMALLMWWQSGSLLLVGVLLLIAVVAYLVIRLIAWLIFKFGVLLAAKSPTAIRFGVSQLKRYPAYTISQISAFGLAFIVMLSTVLIRTELIDKWQSKLPDNAPNHFLVNVQKDEIASLESILKEQQIETSGIYPMVRGRVVKFNDKPVQEVLSEEQYAQARTLQRELNLTWMKDLPSVNKVVEGQWWQPEGAGEQTIISEQEFVKNVAKISISTEMQKMLHLKLGDKVSFDIGGLSLDGVVANVREIEWDSFQPNFFIIFEPKGLANFPASYITSFYLEQAQKPLLNDILKTMPSVTIIELDKIMAQVQMILNQVTSAIEFIMLFVIFAGIAVLYAVLQANREERVLGATLLKTLGAKRSFIRTSLLAELALLGFFAGLLGVVGAEIMVNTLYINAFDIELVLHPWSWLLMPLVGLVFICTVAWWGLGSLLNQPPSKVLRQL